MSKYIKDLILLIIDTFDDSKNDDVIMCSCCNNYSVSDNSKICQLCVEDDIIFSGYLFLSFMY